MMSNCINNHRSRFSNFFAGFVTPVILLASPSASAATPFQIAQFNLPTGSLAPSFFLIQPAPIQIAPAIPAPSNNSNDISPPGEPPESSQGSGPLPPPPPPPPSLKEVRQYAQIIPPSEAEAVALPVLPFDKMVPGVAGEGSTVSPDGRHVNFYQLEGQQDQNIVVVVRNSEDDRIVGLPLTPYVTVFDPAGQVMAAITVPDGYRVPTDDPLLPLDNQLALRLPQSGRYIVAVYTAPGEVGRYGIGWKSDPVRYSYDQTHELTSSKAPPVEMFGKAGQVVRILANSYQFDPVVTLEDDNGNLIARDDDDGGNYNARIDVTLPADGFYRVTVSSANGRTGSYRLMMR